MRHPSPTALALGLLAILLNNSASAQFPIVLDRLLPIVLGIANVLHSSLGICVWPVN